MTMWEGRSILKSWSEDAQLTKFHPLISWKSQNFLGSKSAFFKVANSFVQD